MSTTDTPKTDAFHQEVIDGPLPAIAPRYRDFARTLERQNRELAEALQTLLLALETCKPGASVIKAAESKARAALTKAAL